MTRAGEGQGMQDRLTAIALEFADAGEQALFPWNLWCAVLWRGELGQMSCVRAHSWGNLHGNARAFQGDLAYTLVVLPLSTWQRWETRTNIISSLETKVSTLEKPHEWAECSSGIHPKNHGWSWKTSAVPRSPWRQGPDYCCCYECWCILPFIQRDRTVQTPHFITFGQFLDSQPVKKEVSDKPPTM